MTEESVEPASNKNSHGLSRRQVLGGAAGTAAVSGVGGFLLGSYTGNPLWDDGAGEGPYPRESTSGFSLSGTAAEPEFPGNINIYFDEDVIRWGGFYWANDISRAHVNLPGQHHYQFFNGGGYYSWVDMHSRPDSPTPFSTVSLTAALRVREHVNRLKRAVIYLDLVTHTPEIEIELSEVRGSDFHGIEFWLDGLATSPRISVGIVRPD